MAIDTGALDETDWNDSETEDCYNTTSDWSAVAAALPRESSSPYDVIESGEDKRWRFDMHFTELPENLIPSTECSTLDDSPTQDPKPDNIRYEVAIADAENSSDLYVTAPFPEQGDSDATNEELDLALDIIGGTGTYAAIGAAVGKYIINGDNVSVDIPGDQSSVTWDIDLTGDSDDLPQEKNGEAKAVQLSTRVHNNYDSGDHYVKFIPEYTMRIPRVDQVNCRCEPYTLYKTTAPGVIGFAGYEAQP